MKVIDMLNSFHFTDGQEVEITLENGKTYKSTGGWRFDLGKEEKHAVFSAEVDQFSCADAGLVIKAKSN